MVGNANTSSSGIKDKISDTKVCPYCGENIKIEAVKCKYCQSTLGKTKHQKVKNHITKIITLIIWIFLTTTNAQDTWPIVYSAFYYVGVIALFIGIIALIKGNMPGWGIHRRGIALIVIMVSFAFLVILAKADPTPVWRLSPEFLDEIMSR